MNFMLNIIYDESGRNLVHGGQLWTIKDDGSEGYKIAKHAYDDEMKLHAEGKCCRTGYSSVKL